MRTVSLAGLLLAGVLFLSPAPARSAPPSEPATPFNPAILLRMKALDGLIGDLRHLADEVGLKEEAKQIEAMLKARTSPKGLDGVDPKKPIGLYVVLNKELDQSQGVLLLPIADEKAFFAFLENLDVKVEKGKDGVYTGQIENVPFPVLFRIKGGYLYGTLKFKADGKLPTPDRLPDAEKLLAGGDGMLSLTVDVGNVPAQLRGIAVSYAALHLAELKEKEHPGATERQKAFHQAGLDEVSRVVKSVFESNTRATLKLDLDRKTEELTLALSVEGKPGSALAKDIASLVPAKSVAASILGKDSAIGGAIHLALPKSLEKAFGGAADEAAKEHLDRMDANVRGLVEPLVKAALPTAKAGVLDLAFDGRGPGKNGKYTFIAGLQVRNGKEIDKAIKDVLDKLPEDAKKPIRADVAKVNGTSVHQVQMKDLDRNTKDIFGEGPAYVAVREDAFLFAFGEDALATMKECLAIKAGVSQPARGHLSVGRIVKLARERKEAPEVAKAVFTKKDSDRVTVSVTAGERLEAKVSLKAAVIAFAARLGGVNRKVDE